MLFLDSRENGNDNTKSSKSAFSIYFRLFNYSKHTAASSKGKLSTGKNQQIWGFLLVDPDLLEHAIDLNAQVIFGAVIH
jgi:hypothetical protein